MAPGGSTGQGAREPPVPTQPSGSVHPGSHVRFCGQTPASPHPPFITTELTAAARSLTPEPGCPARRPSPRGPSRSSCTRGRWPALGRHAESFPTEEPPRAMHRVGAGVGAPWEGPGLWWERAWAGPAAAGTAEDHSSARDADFQVADRRAWGVSHPSGLWRERVARAKDNFSARSSGSSRDGSPNPSPLERMKSLRTASPTEGFGGSCPRQQARPGGRLPC